MPDDIFRVIFDGIPGPLEGFRQPFLKEFLYKAEGFQGGILAKISEDICEGTPAEISGELFAEILHVNLQETVKKFRISEAFL